MLALLLMALLVLSPLSARAQTWHLVPAGSDGTPIPGADPSAPQALGGDVTGTASNTYPDAAQIAPYWDAFSPNDPTAFPYTGSQTTASLSLFAFNTFDGNTSLPDGSPLMGSVTAHADAPLSAYYVWQYGDGSAAPPAGSAPPDHADLLVTTDLYVNPDVLYGGSGLTGGLAASASASDGLGGTLTSPAPTADDPYPSVSGTYRYLKRVSSSGVVTVTAHGTLDASASDDILYNAPADDGVPGDLAGLTSADAAASFDASVKVDSREVSISSTLGQTYHKGMGANGNPIRVADVPASDGTVNANSVQGVSSIAYLVHAQGSWAAGSGYLLHCSSGDPAGGTDSGNSSTGQFTPPADPVCSLTVGYGGTVPSEHAYAHLTDYGDGANATANYYVTFHNPWSDLTPDPANPPKPHAMYFTAPGGAWVKGPAASASWTTTITGTATLATSFTAGFTISDLLNLGVSFTPSFSVSVASGIGVTSGAIDDGYQVCPYVEVDYQTRHYLVDHYATNGYNGTIPQSADGSPVEKIGWIPEQSVQNNTFPYPDF